MRRVKKKKARSSLKTNSHPQDSVISSRLAHLNHRQHTGKRLPIHNTSYAALFFIITLTALFMFFARQQVANAIIQVQQGNVQLSGVVNGPPPSVAATIDSPANNSHAQTAIITVSGDCTAGLIIEVYRNNVFAGSLYCGVSGSYTLPITLIPGSNHLIVRIRDSASQYGPDSNAINVFYDLPSNASGGRKVSPGPNKNAYYNNGNGSQILPLLLSTNSVQPGVNSGDQIILKYQIIGGISPYALSVNWGDSSKPSLQSLKNKGSYKLSHIYKKPGQYTVLITASDSIDEQAVIQTVAVVNSSSKYDQLATSCSSQNSNPSCVIQSAILQNIDKIWPPLVGAVLMTFSFWLGERVVYERLGRTTIRR